MTADHVRFPGSSVERHAGTVEQVFDAMETARSAVHAVTMDSGAYGKLCQFLPALLSPVFGLGADALDQAVDVLRETAASLRSTAASMAATDEGGGRRITAAAGMEAGGRQKTAAASIEASGRRVTTAGGGSPRPAPELPL